MYRDLEECFFALNECAIRTDADLPYRCSSGHLERTSNQVQIILVSGMVIQSTKTILQQLGREQRSYGIAAVEDIETKHHVPKVTTLDSQMSRRVILRQHETGWLYTNSETTRSK